MASADRTPDRRADAILDEQAVLPSVAVDEFDAVDRTLFISPAPQASQEDAFLSAARQGTELKLEIIFASDARAAELIENSRRLRRSRFPDLGQLRRWIRRRRRKRDRGRHRQYQQRAARRRSDTGSNTHRTTIAS
jgi:hypothetical protein